RRIRHVPRPPTCNPCRVSHRSGLATSAFARHYSRNHNCFLFLRVLRCFTSPRSLHTIYTFNGGYRNMTRGRFPHSDILGSQVGCHLPEAYRRLPRPSSAPCAKAATVRPLELKATQRHNVEKMLTRCSRPLCSSQVTAPHPHPPTDAAAAPRRTSHTPHPHHQPLDDQAIPATVGSRAASHPNSVSPRQTTQPRPYLPPTG